jgi:hypothetical protein
MARARSLRLLSFQLLGGLGAAALLAGCSANSAAIPAQTVFSAPSASSLLDLTVPDARASKCKGQKNSKDYATVSSEDVKAAGGSLCVPDFGGWSGALQYPATQTSTVTLTSSTKDYTGATLPPPGSQKPIFYLQAAFKFPPEFSGTLPMGKPLVSSHLKAHKPYTIQVSVYLFKLGWSGPNSCYQIAKKSKGGASLAAAGAVFEYQQFGESDTAVEIFNGQLTSTKC